MNKTVMTASMIALAGTSPAQYPTFDWDSGMRHVMITFDGSTLSSHVDPTGGPAPMLNLGQDFVAPADVLEGAYYNSQYGFLADGFISLPAGAAIYIEMLDATPGLEAYEGGMRMMRANHTYAPIFGTDGSDAAWQWGGTMHHPWFASRTLGDYEATFELYLGDAATGERLSGFNASRVTLEWSAIPSPGSAALLGVAGLGALRRRR